MHVDLRDWVFEENLKPWLEIVSTVLGYDFDESDWIAVSAGIAESDSERSSWYEYQLGRVPLRVGLAREPRATVVMLKMGVPEEVADRVKLAVLIAQTYRLTAHR